MIDQRVLVRSIRRSVLRAARVAELKLLAAEAASWRDLRERKTEATELVELPPEHRALRRMLLNRLGGPAID